MPRRGKNIQLYLMDGEAGGRIKCTLANWTGGAYKIPRTELERCRDRQDLKQSGVYFLFGSSDETGRGVVYVGQGGARKNGEGLLMRLQAHKRNPEKDYWTEAVALTTTNNSLGPTEISYLENRFCNLALEAGRFEVKNGNEPTQGNITEEKESEMEEFIDYSKVIIGTLGYKVFIPLDRTKEPDRDDAAQAEAVRLLYLKRTIKGVGHIEATGSQTAEGFVVYRGSGIATLDDNTVSQVMKERRKKAIQAFSENGHEGQAGEESGCVLLQDELFTSPSAAAMFVTGKNAYGMTSWKTADGVTLKELEREAGC